MAAIFISAICLFTLRIVMFSIGAYRERHVPLKLSGNGYRPFVSVVIPARNEESNIKNCINSISQSNYPRTDYEIIAVNDRSTDKTADVLDELQNDVPNLNVININDHNKNGNLKGKPGALQRGIESAKGDVILMTDADCTVTPDWIATVAGAYSDESIGLTSAFTNIKGNRFFDKLQAAEWAYMHSMGCGGVGLRQPLGCYGNNMAVRKDVFDKVGGYNNIKFSVTEDLALQRAVFRAGNKVRYITHPDSAVETLPCTNFKEYLNQHHRWAAGGQDLGWRAAIFIVTSAALWIAMILALVTGQFLWFAAIIGFRLVGDYALVAPSLYALKKSSLNLWVFPSIFFFMLMELVIPFLLLDKNIVWKGQVFRK